MLDAEAVAWCCVKQLHRSPMADSTPFSNKPNLLNVSILAICLARPYNLAINEKLSSVALHNDLKNMPSFASRNLGFLPDQVCCI